MAERINPLYFDYTGRSLTGKEPLLSADQLAYLGVQFAPGSGLADAVGQMPVMPAKNQSLLDAVTQGERGLSARENFSEGNYFTSLFQALGAGGDALYAVPLVGPGLGAAAKTPRAVQKAVKVVSDLPPLQNSQMTQLGTSTLPSYEKAAKTFSEKGKTLDYGAGRGLGAQKINADTFEPYPREGFSPTYTQSQDIPTNSYKNVTSLNVLNVMPKNVRDKAVLDIGRILQPNGEAVITTRGKDVMTAKGDDGPEPMSRVTTMGTYQKGFTQPELREYVQGLLGSNFSVVNAPKKIGQASIVVKKSSE